MTGQREGKYVLVRGMVPYRVVWYYYNKVEQWITFFKKLKKEYDVKKFTNVFEIVKNFENVKVYPKAIKTDVSKPSFLPKKTPSEIQFSFAFNSAEEAATFFEMIGGTLLE